MQKVPASTKNAPVPALEVPAMTLSAPTLAKNASRATLFSEPLGEKSVTGDARSVGRGT